MGAEKLGIELWFPVALVGPDCLLGSDRKVGFERQGPDSSASQPDSREDGERRMKEESQNIRGSLGLLGNRGLTNDLELDLVRDSFHPLLAVDPIPGRKSRVRAQARMPCLDIGIIVPGRPGAGRGCPERG